MIFPDTGEVSFSDGLRIAAHSFIGQLAHGIPPNAASKRELRVEGWKQYILGGHISAFGSFEVEAVVGPEQRVEGVFLSHRHSFYETGTPEDSERRAFHEGIIASDLRGQREFSWGHVFCRLDKQSQVDWLVVIYTPFSNVPLHEREVYRVLREHEDL